MKQSLLDFLQSASNAVAGNVAGPVDLIGAGLNKMGLNVGAAPVGGSEWMKSKGLMRDVQPGAARVLGETAGLLGPALATQFAPQIARGLLQAGDNLAAPRTLNPQTGAIVWHGSPHKFDKFDSSKIGTGEGAQAYGHGIYTAESKKVAEGYAAANQGRGAAMDGLIDDLPKHLQMDVYKLMQRRDVFAKEELDGLAKAYPQIKSVMDAKAANLYKVDLPDEHIAKMLDWDAPLFEQPQKIQDMANLWGKTSQGTGDVFGNHFLKEAESRFGGSAGAADALRSRGIPGIRYLDGGSRGAGQGSSNYVIFPQNEGLLSILERNGVPLK